MIPKPNRRQARIAWLLTTLILAVAPVATSWVNYRGALSVASTLNRGQVTVVEAALREAFHPWEDLPDPAALSEFIEAQSEMGVRYVALLDEEGDVQVSAGQPSSSVEVRSEGLRGPPGRMIDLGERIRTFVPRPQVRRPDTAASSGPGGRSGQRRTPFALLLTIVEFEPVLATELVAGASRNLLLSALVAAVLAFAAMFFWRLSGKYQEARLRLEEQRRLSQLGEMSAVLAHEIRNPLASLKGTAQLLAERLPAESRERSRADRIVYEAVRLETLTSDLLDFARSGPHQMIACDPADVARISVEDVEADAMEIDTAEAPDRWTFDPGRIRQALVNLLQNARQASPEGRPPTLRVARERDRLIFEVRDHGPGIPEGSENRIFDPFYTTRTNGTGLGLAVVSRIVEMHEGSISARNHAEGGAVFRIEIPPSQT